MKMEFEEFIDQVNKIDHEGLTISRKFHESEKVYNARKKAFTINLAEGLNKLDLLIELISQAQLYYDSHLKCYEYLKGLEPLMEFIYPHITKWDTVEEMHKDLDSYIRYYSIIPEFNVCNFYNIAREIEKEYLLKARQAFIEDALDGIPTDRSVVIIQSTYSPFCNDDKYHIFFSLIRSMQIQESGQLARIYDVNNLEWIGLCPSFTSKERIEYLSKEWHGIPKDSKVFYV